VEASRRLGALVAAAPPLPPDSAPAEPESQKHFVDREIGDVLADLREWVVHR
jgi:hypothetical protein